MLVPRPMMLPGFRIEPQPTSTLSPSMAPIFFASGFDLAVFGVDFHQKFIGFYVGGDGTGTHVGFIA